MELISNLEEYCSVLPLPNLKSLKYLQNKNIKIQNISQFQEWKNSELSSLSLDVEIENYLISVKTLKENSQEYIQRIQKSLDIIADLSKNNEFVVEKTGDLQSKTNSIIREKENLQELANDLELKLSYFNSLEMVIKLLSSSGQEICLEKDFIPSLSLLDHCAQFLRQNMDFKESGVYYIKTKQCLTRSMMIIKMHIVNSLRGIAGEIKDVVVCFLF